jgi:hypothetical protein
MGPSCYVYTDSNKKNYNIDTNLKKNMKKVFQLNTLNHNFLIYFLNQ